MHITLNQKQIDWIKNRIDEHKSILKDKFINGNVKDIDSARIIIREEDFLNKLLMDLGTESESVEVNDYKIPEESLSSEDVGAPILPEINSTKSTDNDVSVISSTQESAQEQMSKAQEDLMSDIFNDI